jgi:hypothetical protein
VGRKHMSEIANERRFDAHFVFVEIYVEATSAMKHLAQRDIVLDVLDGDDDDVIKSDVDV